MAHRWITMPQIIKVWLWLSLTLVVGAATAQSFEVTMTAYSSTVDQTNSQPFITATNQRVRMGIIAASRDLLATELPHGTRVRVVYIHDDPRACGGWDPGMVLEVQDTMNRRKRNTIDLWLPSRREARLWGRCRVVLEVV